MWQLYGIDSKGVKHLINEGDLAYLDRIVEARDGMCWIGGECCSFQILRK